MTLKIGIMYQSEFGGTNALLGKLSHWMSNNHVDVVDIERAKRDNLTLDYIILPTSEIASVFTHVRQGLKFNDYIIWSMGHGAFRAAFINERMINKSKKLDVFFRVIIYIVGFFLQHLLKRKKIIFTDCVGLSHDVGNMGGYKQYQDLVFPIVVEHSDLVHQRKDASLRFGWVGRVDYDFKVGPLIKLLQDLDRHHCDGLINIQNFTIIGNGNAIDLIKKEIEALSFNVNILGMVPNNVLSNVIDDNIDVLFAMGTSVLEGAKIGLPSIIVSPFSLGSSEQSGYRWVFDSIGYSLGEFSLENVCPAQRKVKLDIILDELAQFGYNYHASKSSKYVDSFYPDKVFNELSRFIYAKKYNIGYKDKLLFTYSSIFQVLKKLMKKLKNKELRYDQK